MKKKDAGRPAYNVDWDLVEKCFENGSNVAQTAAAIGICSDTLCNYVKEKYGMYPSDLLAKCRAKGEDKILAAQMDVATNQKNPNMLIWLGKNRLGQSDSPMNVSVSSEALKDLNSFFGQLQAVQKSLEKDKACSNDPDESQTDQ